MRVQHISPAENRAYVLNLATDSLPLPRPLLANARSLGLRRADDTITVLARLQLVNQRQYARHISLSCHPAFRNWSNQARNCTSSGFLTLPAMQHPQQPSALCPGSGSFLQAL